MIKSKVLLCVSIFTLFCKNRYYPTNGTTYYTNYGKNIITSRKKRKQI